MTDKWSRDYADHLLHHTGVNDNHEPCQTQIDNEVLSGPIPQEGSLQETSSTVSEDRAPSVNDANSTDENNTPSNTTPSQTE